MVRAIINNRINKCLFAGEINNRLYGNEKPVLVVSKINNHITFDYLPVNILINDFTDFIDLSKEQKIKEWGIICLHLAFFTTIGMPSDVNCTSETKSANGFTLTVNNGGKMRYINADLGELFSQIN